jgi:NAD(P)-dependent dehydrogenase (short-subunit alcohol dehydrogenase family)
MSQKLEGKVAVITGGSSGIGFATAKLFVNEGAYVFITGRRQKELDKAVKAIGQNVTGVRGNVAKLADLDRLYQAVKAKGRIDIVFANAGTGGFVPLATVTEEFYDNVFNTNVKGTLFTVQSIAATERWWFNDPQRLRREREGDSQLLALWREQGRSPQLRLGLDRGAEGPSYPLERP